MYISQWIRDVRGSRGHVVSHYAWFGMVRLRSTTFGSHVGYHRERSYKNYEQREKEANKKFSFHLFPRNIEKRNKWLEVLNLQNSNIPKTAAVCSAHFREDDYVPGYSFRKLKEDVIPYLSGEGLIRQQKAEPVIENLGSIEHQEIEPVLDNVEHHKAGTSSENNEEKAETIIHNTMVDRSTSISPARIFSSPTKIRLRKIHAHKMAITKRKLSISVYKKKKLQEKCCTMKNLLKELRKRNLITVEDSDVLQHLDEELVQTSIQ